MLDHAQNREAIALACDELSNLGSRAAPRTAVNVIDETLEVQLDQPPVIDHFELLERIGIGGFGTVWRAYDQRLDRQVAIKVPRAVAPDETQIKRFLQEARTASQLNHPGIVGVYEVGQFGSSCYIVSDFIQGRTLAHWLQEQPRSPGEVATMCHRLAQAIDHAHEFDVVHRDLKPANILVDADDLPHITDFGLARRLADETTLTADGQILGTPAYMSPEQVRGNRQQIDRRADIYALGVVMFELLTGEPPFRGSVQMLVHQVLTSEAPRPRGLSSTIPRDLENICLKCLEKEPRRRYQTARDLAHDLERFLQGEAVAARPIPASMRVWRWCKRNRLVSIVTIILFLVLLAGVATTTSQWMRADAAAAREAQTRAEFEQLTKQILELAGRLQQLEQERTAAILSESRFYLQQDATVRRSSFGLPKEPGSLLDRPQQAELLPIRFGRAPVGQSLGVMAKGRNSALARQSDVAELQSDAQRALRRLERISPALAQQCRGVFPKLVED